MQTALVPAHPDVLQVNIAPATKPTAVVHSTGDIVLADADDGTSCLLGEEERGWAGVVCYEGEALVTFEDWDADANERGV
jgi:hypothetical protein